MNMEMVNSNKLRYSLGVNNNGNVEYKKIKDFVGRYAKRIKPFVYANGVIDYSFTNESAKILSANTDGSFSVNFYGNECKMDREWNDGNWTESTALDSVD